MRYHARFSALAATAALLLPALPAAAQDLKIGVASEVTSADPHFHNLGPNNALRRHIFEAIVETDADQKVIPALATSWKALNNTTWEFKLRPGVTFTSGKAFTARDIIYTYCRVPKVENSPSSFVAALRPIEAIETPDPLTIVFKTAAAQPLLPIMLSSVGILSADAHGAPAVISYDKAGCKEFGTAPKSVDFIDPARAVGTGPYKLAEYTRGTQVVITRNEAYWGAKPIWDKVTWRPLTNAGARVAALLAGDVDFVENPPIQDQERIKGAGFQIVQKLSSRIIYVHLDQFAGADWKSPGIKGTDKNPLMDVRVRKALSMAINRPAIVERIMGGSAVAAGEVLPWPLFGATKDFPVETHDVEAAKKLLTEAGYPNGFEITLGTPNDRYINDEKVAQAIAQMWARIGVKTSIDAMTASTFFDKRNKYQFSAYLAGWGSDTGEIGNSLNALLVTHEPQKGLGHTNRGRYSNKEVDRLTGEAAGTIDDAKREAMLQAASKLAMAEVGLIPLHFEVTPWAYKKGLAYKARTDQYTLATEVERAPVN